MIVLNAVLPIFTIIMAGYGIRRFFITDDIFWKDADRLVYYILLPLSLMYTTSSFVYEPAMLSAGLMVFGLVSVMAVIGFVCRGCVRMSGAQFTSVFQGIVRPNFYISLSMGFILFGKEGVQFLAFMLIFLIFSATVYSILVLDRYGEGGAAKGMRHAMRRLSRNPIILSTVAGFIIGIIFGGFPEFASRTLDVFSHAALPLALLGVGASLKFSALRSAWRLVAVAAVSRLMIAPVLCLIAAHYLGLGKMEMTCCALLFSVPSAASSITFASQMGGDVRLMSQILTIQTILSFVTLSAVLMVLETL